MRFSLILLLACAGILVGLEYGNVNMNFVRKILSVALFLAFIGTALFGFSMMSHDASHMPVDCILNFMNTTACPQASAGLAMSIHHVNAYQTFFSATGMSYSPFLFSILLSALLAVFLFVYISRLRNTDAVKFQKLASYFSFSKKRQMTFAYALATQDEDRWIAHKENSPSHS